MRVHVRRAQLADKHSVFKLARLFTSGAEPVTLDEFMLVYETVLIDREFESSVVFVAELIAQEVDAETTDSHEIGSEQNSQVDQLVPGEIVGYSLLSISRLLHAAGLSGHLHEIVVAPEARGLGVGEALIRANETYARNRGVRQISASTARFGNFYNHLGFEIVGEHYRKTNW